MATNIIRPKIIAQIVFCSHGNSYGLVGDGNRHSVRKSLWKIQKYHQCCIAKFRKISSQRQLLLFGLVGSNYDGVHIFSKK